VPVSLPGMAVHLAVRNPLTRGCSKPVNVVADSTTCSGTSLQDGPAARQRERRGWSAGLAQRGLNLLPHDPRQLVPGDQQLLTGGLLPQPLQDPSTDQNTRKLPARLGEPP
jgi:hypothetical protein